MNYIGPVPMFRALNTKYRSSLNGKGFGRRSRQIFRASKSTVTHIMQCNESGSYFETIAHILCTLAYKVLLVSRPENVKINCKKAVT